MKIIPAIDLLDGKCVRLYQGDYQQKVNYQLSPIDQVKLFADSGCDKVHIVDLSAAKDQKLRQLDLIEKMIQASDMKVETGGGLRTIDEVKRLYDLGVDQAILGTVACTHKDVTQQILDKYPQTILAADLFIENNNKYLASHGWQTKQSLSLDDFIKWYPNCLHFLCTDISKDGALKGPNFSLYQDLSTTYDNKHWIASGGVSCLEDLIKLKKTGASSVVIGKALYENRFTLDEALSC